MIKKLQRKITIIMAGALLAVFAVIFVTLNILMRISSAQKTELHLQTVADNDGFPATTLGYENMFYVKLNPNGGIIEVNDSMSFHMATETVETYVEQALDHGKERGDIDRYRFLLESKEYGRILVFAERGAVIGILTDLVSTSLIVAGISCVLFLILSTLLSRWAVKPVREAFNKQRQFVSDAGHELKTPLTIIITNTDILENRIGSDDQLAQIREQSGRMSGLIRDMLSLARTDEGEGDIRFTEFDLSGAVLSTVLEFEGIAFEEEKKLTYNITESIRSIGNEQQIRQLVGILLDNAIKHSNKQGDIRVELKQENDKNLLSVYNTGVGVTEEERGRIFERFYRSDTSRSRETGGYGLGLAIAASIVRQHGGKISVSGTAGEWVQFFVKF